MKYRTKLYISFVVISLISIVVALVIFSTNTERLIFNIFRSRSASIVATAASQLNSKIITEANFSSSTKTPAYTKARKLLRKVLVANRRADVYVSVVYTLYIHQNDPTELLYGVQTGDDPAKPAIPN